MEKKKNGKKQRTQVKKKLPYQMKILLILGVVLLVASYARGFKTVFFLKNEITKLEDELYDLRQNNSKLLEELDYAKSDAAVEKLAREKLGLVMPDEILIRRVEAKE